MYTVCLKKLKDMKVILLNSSTIVQFEKISVDTQNLEK